MFNKIQKTIQNFIIKETDEEYIEYQKIKKKWKKNIKKTIQKNAEIIDFTKGTIILKAKNAAWKNDLVFMQEEIKKKFQAKNTQ